MSVVVSETTIRAPQTPEENDAFRRVFLEEFARTGIDPTFAGIDDEFAHLPGIYAPPQGALLLALDSDGTVLGAGAMRPLPGPGDCSLTGVVVSENARGRGLGRELVAALIRQARAAGHRCMHLEAADEQPAAMALWNEVGFVPAPAYFPNPRPGSLHMSLDLGIIE